MTKAASITQETLKSLLSYDPDTGHFCWLVARGPRHVGDIAGTVSGQGYRQLTINTVQVRANRMAFLYMTGKHPAGQVDHINGDRLDDRWSNLRDVTASINQHNRRKAHRTNKSGALGVFFLPKKNKWTARIRKAGTDHYIGYFDTKEAAHIAYVRKKQQIHEGCTL